MERFVRDLKKYYRYMLYSAEAQLKNEVAGSFLNWLWWILDPLLFMLVYTFVYAMIFGRSQQYLCAFIFIGYSSWTFFQKSINSSVRLIKQYRGVVSKVYVPKFALVVSTMLVQGFKLLISLGLVFITMLLYQVPYYPTVFWLFPYLVMLFLLTFGLSMLLLHFGVFVEDLANIVNVILRLLFYLSGVFYNLETSSMNATLRNALIHLNPTCFVITSLRNAMLYGQTPQLSWLVAWMFVGVALSVIGIRVVYRYERRYVKAI
ncbi:MAG: ABC transporter permease [Clostridiales bacterium]|nr:ABC transporter permease [Clostridiales bacterium]